MQACSNAASLKSAAVLNSLRHVPPDLLGWSVAHNSLPSEFVPIVYAAVNARFNTFAATISLVCLIENAKLLARRSATDTAIPSSYISLVIMKPSPYVMCVYLDTKPCSCSSYAMPVPSFLIAAKPNPVTPASSSNARVEFIFSKMSKY